MRVDARLHRQTAHRFRDADPSRLIGAGVAILGRHHHLEALLQPKKFVDVVIHDAVDDGRRGSPLHLPLQEGAHSGRTKESR